MSLAGKYSRKESIARREIAGEHFLIPVCGSPVDLENIFRCAVIQLGSNPFSKG